MLDAFLATIWDTDRPGQDTGQEFYDIDESDVE